MQLAWMESPWKRFKRYTLSLPVNEIEIYQSLTHFVVKHLTPPTGIACKASLATTPKNS